MQNTYVIHADFVVASIRKLKTNVGGIAVPGACAGVDSREPQTFCKGLGLVNAEAIKG